MAKKKVLLMGKAHSGKTSMRSIIFANYLARDTMRLSPTLDVEHHHVKFLGDLVLNLWDCGGQDAFYESYFERDRETIFRSVELLIYVFDIESDCPERDFDHFTGVLEAIEENSPDSRIVVLVHKMDLVAEDERLDILEDRKRLVEESCASCGVVNFQCFGTSIWDETLYKAWSEIVTNLIPNIGVLESHLDDFCRTCDADEVVLFERATFLVISHAQAKITDQDSLAIAGDDRAAITASSLSGNDASSMPADGLPDTINPDGSVIRESTEGAGAQSNALMSPEDAAALSSPQHKDEHASHSATEDDPFHLNSATTSVVAHPNQAVQKPQQQPPRFDAHRFEKISNIVKQFKLSCGKAQAQFQGMEVRNSRFAAYIDAFTANTYIMVIVGRKNKGVIRTAATTLLNIRNARGHFERFIPRS